MENQNEGNQPETNATVANQVDALVRPESVTLSESGAVVTEHHDGFDWPGELTFECVNNFVHDADRHFEELQYLALGMIGELEKERNKTKELQQELGFAQIQLNHKTTLLESCEKALEGRDSEQDKIKAKIKTVIKWCQENIESGAQVTTFAIQIRDHFERREA